MSEAGDGAAERPDSPSPSSTAAPPPSAPAAPTALREDQIANAVAFLSHPKVRASAAASKRDFLRGKGLTEAEIDEAFRRVPQDAAPAAAPSPAPAAAAPAAAAPSAVATTLQHLQPQPYVQQPGAMVPYQPPQPQGVRWTQVVLGAGFLAASAYAAKSLLWPYMEGAYYSWRGQVRPPPRPRRINGGSEAEGEEGVSPEATRAVAEAIQAQTAELRGSIDSIKGLVAALEAGHKERASGSADAGDGLTVTELRSELRSFAQTLHEIASPAPSGASAKLENELGEIKGLLAELLRSPSGSRTPRGAGSKDAASGEATPLSVTSALAARGLVDDAAAAGGEQAAQETAQPAAAQGSEQAAAVSGSSPAPPPHPASYLEVLEMLERGQTPPGIRTDINDKPPNPLAAPAEPKLKPRAKPWERSSGAGGSGSSISSLGSLPAAAAAPATAAGSGTSGRPAAPEAAAAPAASTPEPASPAGGSYAEAAARALSPVRAPSPADEGATHAQQLQQQQEQQGPADEQQVKPSSFQSPKRAASIFEAVAPAPESPNIIAGRLSPGAAAPVARSGSASSLGGGPAPQQTSTFSEILAAAEQRASASGTAVPAVPEGSGIGRPISRGWKPPPIPTPTLSGSSGSGMNMGSPPTDEAAAAGASSAAAGEHAADGPVANGTAVRSPSAASLGADFASA